MVSEKFPEAFERFEDEVDIDDIESFHQLLIQFKHWAGRNWKDTPKQLEALKDEARDRGMHVPSEKPPVRVYGYRYREPRTVPSRIVPPRTVAPRGYPIMRRGYRVIVYRDSHGRFRSKG